MNNQDYLDHNLRELFKSVEPQLHIPADPKAVVLDRLLREAETSTEYERTRIPWGKLAVAAMVLVAIVLGICLMGNAGVAFADILEHIQRRGYTFTYWVKQKDGELKRMGRGMVLQPGLIRWDMPDDQGKGLAIVTDAINRKMRWVTTAGKDLGVIEVPEDIRDDPNFYDSEQNFMLGPVEELWGMADGTEEPLGEATKGGVDVTGYRVRKTVEIRGQKGTFIYTIWANAASAMPQEVLMETRDPNGRDDGFATVLRDFDFDADIDESLFGLGPPPEPEDIDEDRLVIQPGVGMVDLPLGADQTKIEEILGPSDFMAGEGLYQYTGLLVWAREGKVYAFHCGDIGKPDSQHVTGCAIRTKEGIGMGSTEQDVINAYGEPASKRDVRLPKGGSRWRYQTGTIFGLHDGKVHYMLFQLPRQEKSEASGLL